jgi:hypothetical protein
MRERRAQVVLAVRAFEEADPDGLVLPKHMRTAATRRALMVTGLSDWQGELTRARNYSNGETVLRRARLLFGDLRRKVPVLRGALRIARLGAGTAPAVIGTALVLGLMTNVLGPRRQINLLSFPILGLLGWNVMMYVAMLGVAVTRLAGGRRGGEPLDDDEEEEALAPRSLSTHLSGLFLKGALWRRLHGHRFTGSGTEGGRRITAKAMVRFGALWHRHAGTLLTARVRRTLHLGALAMMLGVIGGMYVRGLAFEYRATWESTWLEPGQVQSLLGWVLGPAAAVLGVSLPELAPLQGPDGEGGAALWIHLYAVTAVLYVVLPRTALALIEGWRCSRLSTDIPVDLEDSYFRRQFAAWRGATRQVDILPYSFSPQPVALDRLKALLQDSFGARARIVVREPLAYGGEAAAIPLDEGSGGAAASGERESFLVVLLNLAQSPEIEVHGAFLRELKERLEEPGGHLLLLIDVSTYHERVRDPERRQQRLRAWVRVAGEVGLSAVDLELDRPIRDNQLVDLLMTSMREAMWPNRKAAEAS